MFAHPTIAHPAFAHPTERFPLFEAPLDEAVRFDRWGHCTVCLYLPKPCFRLGAGSDVVVHCRGCGTGYGLDIGAQEHRFCRVCGRRVRFPRMVYLWDFIGPKRYQTVDTCCDCLRGGRTAISKLTEYGIVTWETAQEGLIDWVAEDALCPLPLVSLGRSRKAARVPGDSLIELVHTPVYYSWTTPVWLFCCGEPMIYAGAWSKEQFDAAARERAGYEGKALLAAILEDARELDIDAAWDNGFGYSPRAYVFRCAHCHTLRANWDQAPAPVSPPPVPRDDSEPAWPLEAHRVARRMP